MKFLSLCIMLATCSRTLLADEVLCLMGGRQVAIERDSMDVITWTSEGKITKKLSVERVLSNRLELLGFHSFSEMKSKYCSASIKNEEVIYYPSYEKVLGQNGFYWYLDAEKQKPVTHLLLIEGRDKNGVCEKLLEGAPSHLVTCP